MKNPRLPEPEVSIRIPVHSLTTCPRCDRAARHLAFVADCQSEWWEALHRLGELAWCFDAAMLSELPGPWRDRQGRFVGGDITTAR